VIAAVLAYLHGGWGSVTAAYAVTIGALVVYAVVVIVRGRQVNKQLPPDERRWM
jgi:hypothetical protein